MDGYGGGYDGPLVSIYQGLKIPRWMVLAVGIKFLPEAPSASATITDNCDVLWFILRAFGLVCVYGGVQKESMLELE